MLTHNLGYPRIGADRQLKRASERYWAHKISAEELLATGRELRRTNWQLQRAAGIDLIPSNDFSLYDQVLDMTLSVGAIPARYQPLAEKNQLDLYFAMARGVQDEKNDITALEMTKWFDTNYHYLVPEFTRNQLFGLTTTKAVDEFREALELGIRTKPVLLGPVSFLLLGKEKEEGFNRIELLDRILPVYYELIGQLTQAGAEWIQFDEPYLVLDLTAAERVAFTRAYGEIRKRFPALKILLAGYFGGYGDNLFTALRLPVDALHLDLVRCPELLESVLTTTELPEELKFSLGLVDGRNIWKNNFDETLRTIDRAVQRLGNERLLLAPSCSLLHCPCDLDAETDETSLPAEVRQWLAFAKQKVTEVTTLCRLAGERATPADETELIANRQASTNRAASGLIHRPAVKDRVEAIGPADDRRQNGYGRRQVQQRERIGLPLFPTTTIGSFPQTKEVRKQRAQFKRGTIDRAQYDAFLEQETERAIRWQESIDLDVLVHGEFERNDMVEYFGERLAGFAFTRNGWVQSYGSRCVKPPIIYGDVYRPEPMTVRWSTFAQALTDRPVKGMLTGPVTILQWSFVRNDQPRSRTCDQIALAIRDEAVDLERAGIQVIQIDEPAIREGLPLRKDGWAGYLTWAIRAFRIAASGVRDTTQIHTHMCYSEFNDIIDHIAAMDADVITIECSRSQMELLDAFADFAYPNEIGPGVYDIHSPRVPSRQEMVRLLDKATTVLPASRIWVNPDCGLKTRNWEETREALCEMVGAAKEMRKAIAVGVE